MELRDIVKEIYDSSTRLENGSKEIFKLAEDLAVKEMEYRKALAYEIIRLKDEKMSITLIPDIARGNVADIKFQRDLAEEKLKAARTAIDAIQTRMNGLQSILKYQVEV